MNMVVPGNQSIWKARVVRWQLKRTGPGVGCDLHKGLHLLCASVSLSANVDDSSIPLGSPLRIERA